MRNSQKHFSNFHKLKVAHRSPSKSSLRLPSSSHAACVAVSQPRACSCRAVLPALARLAAPLEERDSGRSYRRAARQMLARPHARRAEPSVQRCARKARIEGIVNRRRPGEQRMSPGWPGCLSTRYETRLGSLPRMRRRRRCIGIRSWSAPWLRQSRCALHVFALCNVCI